MANFGGFNFNTAAAGATNPAGSAPPATPVLGFGLATSAAPAAAGGFNFGGGAAAGGASATPAANFFGAPAASAAPAAGGFGLGGAAATPPTSAPAAGGGGLFGGGAGGFGFGTATPAASAAPAAPASAAPAIGFGLFGAATSMPAAASAAPAATPLFGGLATSTPAAPTASAAPVATPLSFGIAATTAGATPQLPATSAPAAAAGGFSFAAAPTAAAGGGGGTAPATSAAPAAAATSAAPLFGALATPASSAPAASTALAAPATSAAPAVTLQVPNPLKGKSLEDLLRTWTEQLEGHSRCFVEAAARLERLDAAVLSNRRVLLEVEGDLRGVDAGQCALEKQLGLIETHQKEVHDALAGVEGEAARLFAAEQGLLDADAVDRDRLYQRAQAVSHTLGVLAGELTSSVDQVNRLAAASLGDPDSALGAAVRVLNTQLQALGQLEARVDDMAAEVDALKGPRGGQGVGLAA